MKRAKHKLILDADGVFFNERPYWNAALATALSIGGLRTAVNGRWDELADVAYGPMALQQVAKRRGCNSNWDLATILTRALEDRETNNRISELLTSNKHADAVRELQDSADRLWNDSDAQSSSQSNGSRVKDPIEGFGVKRKDPFFTSVVQKFQLVLNNRDGVDWKFPRHALKEPLEEICAAFDACRDLGYELRVCTGRHRTEANTPIEDLGLAEYLPPTRVTSADEVDRAEAMTGKKSLGKPHWFAPTCATIGFDAAVGLLKGELPTFNQCTVVYVGDALADYLAVADCCRLRLPMNYIHIRSGVTTNEQEVQIAQAPQTLGIINLLGELPPLLQGLES